MQNTYFNMLKSMMKDASHLSCTTILDVVKKEINSIDFVSNVTNGRHQILASIIKSKSPEDSNHIDTFITKCSEFGVQFPSTTSDPVFQNVTHRRPPAVSFSLYFYTAITPIVILLGILGNCLCIKIFTRQRMRKQTTSIYFAALSFSDLLVLLFFVFPEWLERGVSVVADESALRLYARHGFCQVFVYISYALRFLSVWMLVISTIERYIGVCYPLLRPRICSRPNAKKIILSVVVVSLAISAWKPALTTVVQPSLHPSAEPVFLCATRHGYNIVSNLLDSIYATFLSIVPSCLILVFNILLSRRLLIFRRSDTCLSHREMMGMQFAALLVLISTAFLLFTWPYYVCFILSWSQDYSFSALNQTTISSHDSMAIATNMDAALHITKAIFYVNYAVNFFLYTFTSQYFRSEMKRIFTLKDRASRPSTAEDIILDTTTPPIHHPMQMVPMHHRDMPIDSGGQLVLLQANQGNMGLYAGTGNRLVAYNTSPGNSNHSDSGVDDGDMPVITLEGSGSNPIGYYIHPMRGQSNSPMMDMKPQRNVNKASHAIRVYEKKYCFKKLHK